MVATSDACLFRLLQTYIPAYSTADLTLEYTPCSLSLLEEGVVRVESEDIGVHDFAVSGKGAPPVAAETTTLVAVLGTSSQGVVSWRNPFSEPVEACVGCSMSSHEIAMMLDEASTTQTIQPFAMLQVPLSFCPTSLRVATGDVTVTVAQPPGLISAGPLTWHMPVRGTAEAVQMTGTALKFRCKARATLDEVRPGMALLPRCNMPSNGLLPCKQLFDVKNLTMAWPHCSCLWAYVLNCWLTALHLLLRPYALAAACRDSVEWPGGRGC